jgi:hypothetical protein
MTESQALRRLLETAKDDMLLDYEEEQRELYVLYLQSHARDALDERDMLQEELVMLAMREDEQELMDMPMGSAVSAPPPNKAMDPNRPGIEITRTFKTGDQLVLR